MEYQPPPRPSTEFLSMAQFLISGLGMVFALIAAGLLFMFGFIGLFSEAVGMANAAPLFGLAWLCLLVAGLAAPSLLLSIRRLWGIGPGLPSIPGFRLANLAILVWPLVLVLGSYLAGQSSIAWLVMPPLQILAVGLPVWWLVEFANRRLPVGSLQRRWGIFNFSMFLSTPAVIVVEMLVMGFLFAAAVFWVSTQPELLGELERLGRRIITRQPDPDVILEYLRPYLQNPLVIFSTLAVIAGLVPLIEELLKPLALWALAGRNLSPAQGFAGGALAGGAFALLESMMSLSSPSQDTWAALAAGRAGTALLHVTMTALAGWAMAMAWQRGSYLRLGATYLLAVGLHGAWNMFSVFAGLNAVFDGVPPQILGIEWMMRIAPYGLVVLVALVFTLLVFASFSIQREKQPA